MTAYGPECFTMNEVNRLKILQVVIHGRLIISLASNETAWHNGSALSASVSALSLVRAVDSGEPPPGIA